MRQDSQIQRINYMSRMDPLDDDRYPILLALDELTLARLIEMAAESGARLEQVAASILRDVAEDDWAAHRDPVLQ